MKIFNYICENCGDSFQSYSNKAKYCIYCRDKIQSQRNMEYKKKKLSGESKVLGSIQICPQCSCEYTLNSPAQKLCPDCQKKLSVQKKIAAGAVYSKENYEQVRFNVPLGKRDEIKTYARSRNMSVNQLLTLALDEYIRNHPDPDNDE